MISLMTREQASLLASAYAQSTLEWVFDGSGEWVAESKRMPGELHVIQVMDDGTFSVCESSPVFNYSRLCSDTLKDAKARCWDQECRV